MVTYSRETFRRFLQAEGRPKHITVVLGNFDGVHTGHRELLRAASFEKKMSGGISVVWTFQRRADQTDCVITAEERLRLFKENGIDAVVLCDFDEVRGLSPEDFVKEILCGDLSADVCICGFNYRFGHRASGTAEDLKNICRRYGIETKICDKVVDGDQLMEDALECGAADFAEEDGIYEIYTEPDDLSAVCEDLEKKGYKFESAEVEKVPSTYVSLTTDDDRKFMNLLLENLEEDEDIVNVWHNWDEE